MSTLVIGLGNTVTREQAAEMKKIALAQLPEGTKVLIVADCTGLAVVEEVVDG